MEKHIQRSAKKAQAQKKEYSLFNRIFVFLKDPLPEDVNLTEVLAEIEKKVPEAFLYGIDEILIGQFKELVQRNVEALFADGAIYVTNEQDNEEDMIDDLVHEIGHALEASKGLEIYGNSLLEREYLGKKKALLDMLQHEGIDIKQEWYTLVEYEEGFDLFLYETMGYPMLTSLTMGLFISPYGITSLREYFANAFEEYFSRDKESVKQVSPQVYKKIIELLETQDD